MKKVTTGDMDGGAIDKTNRQQINFKTADIYD